MAVEETQREGIIAEFYDGDTGRIKEEGTASDFDFVRPGAQVEFIINDRVLFITITTPSGKKIVKSVIKK